MSTFCALIFSQLYRNIGVLLVKLAYSLDVVGVIHSQYDHKVQHVSSVPTLASVFFFKMQSFSELMGFS